jgi:hypothetical protein
VTWHCRRLSASGFESPRCGSWCPPVRPESS